MDNRIDLSILQRNKNKTTVNTSRNFFKNSKIFGVLLSLLFIVPTHSLAENEIKWSMPDRLLENTDYPGYDATSPIPKYDPAVQMLPVNGWLVNFDVCTDTIPVIVGVEWFVDGELVSTQNGCLFNYNFPEEGVYKITANLTDEFDNFKTVTQEITVQDWLIIALGDSYGSGEGNPVKPVTAKALEEYSQLIQLVTETEAEIQLIEDTIPSLQDAQISSQQAHDNSLDALGEAENVHIDLQNQLQALLDIIDNVESDQSVLAAEENIDNAEQLVDGWLAQVAQHQKDYDNCHNFIDCIIKLSTLNNSNQLLQAAEADLIAAENKLDDVIDDAVVKYSAGTGIDDFDELISQRDSKSSAVKSAKNDLDAAQSAYDKAVAALQQAKDAVIDSQGELVDLKVSAEETSLIAQEVFIENLPVWTTTAPSWGTPEPDYADIILNGATPGEALRCHRSMKSGQARAALRIEQADPHTSVTFLHLSCSGASIDNMTGNYEGQDIGEVLSALTSGTLNFDYAGLPEQEPIQAQIAAASLKVAGREPDAIIVSIGANDIKVSDIITECILGQPCHEDLPIQTEDHNNAVLATVEEICQPTDLFNNLADLSLESASFSFTESCISNYNAVDANVSAGAALITFNDSAYGSVDELGSVTGISLAEKFQRMKHDEDINKATLDKHFPTMDSNRVYITQYLNHTSDDVGDYCGWTEENPAGAENLKNIPGVTVSENTWSDQTVSVLLDEEIRNATELYQWNYITKTGVADETISSVSKKHGYCADDNWVIRLSESLLTQQDNLGMLHPNSNGHELYQQSIVTQLTQDFYPDGLNMPPRAPDKKQSKFPTDDSVDVSVASESNDLGSLSPMYLLIIFSACMIRIAKTKRSEKCISHLV